MGCKFCGEWIDTSIPQTVICKRCGNIYKRGYNVGFSKGFRKGKKEVI